MTCVRLSVSAPTARYSSPLLFYPDDCLQYNTSFITFATSCYVRDIDLFYAELYAAQYHELLWCDVSIDVIHILREERMIVL